MNKIQNLRSSNPKEYWKIINSKSKSNGACHVSITDFYNHFKVVNDCIENDVYQYDLDQGNFDDGFLLNSAITEHEILQAVNSLKSNKSSGIDEILNEYIVASIRLCSFIQYSIRYRHFARSMADWKYFTNI
jgi:hypothetical protein